MNYAQITVIEPNGVKRSRPLTSRGLAIGRSPDNDLVIAYDLVSRHHAQVTFDGNRYYVTDLDSANGTFLGNTKLIPNEPTSWSPGIPLQIGNVSLHLGQGRSTDTPPPQQPVAGSPSARRSRREREETLIGPVVGPSGEGSESSGINRTVLILLVLLLALCACSAVGAGAYYLFLFE